MTQREKLIEPLNAEAMNDDRRAKTFYYQKV